LKVIPKQILVAYCTDCEEVIGIVADDCIYSDGLQDHIEQKGDEGSEHKNLHIISIKTRMIRTLLDHLEEKYVEEDKEELLRPAPVDSTE